MVRGKNVNFSTRTINSLFGTPAINTPGELQEFLEDHPPRLNVPIHFSHTKLTVVAKNWLRFISAQLLPLKHTFEVTRERVVMIFAILTNVLFDIGRFLHKSIWKSVMGGLTVKLEEWVDRLADEVHHLQLQQEQQFAYQQQWWALWANQMHIPINNCPHYPPDEPAEPPPADMGDE
ncbi:hypothetical protein CDL12_14350 [Handroanthus impetiginosus]|uniref:Putative plant transposon protein domain-containing protein n=1 Tax=Handroanthus impetiginosus TaxID=429701 RepID=A0A2G9H692_9LAMI|nr:hypothetical protein CDL12_14350 [Handroanthus impetiginosus]